MPIACLSSLEPLPAAFRGGVIALGNFDGFHAGHQAVAARAVAMARAMGVPAIIATFDPHPVRHFKPDAPWFRLTTLEQRQRLFEAAGADAMLVFHFDAGLAAMSAADFIAQMLVERFGAGGIVTGQDFVFGRQRGGDVATLRAAADAGHFAFDAVAPVDDAGEVISSSRIRAALQSGDCDTATRLLTRPFAIEGRVQHGNKQGRQLGYPTANIAMGHYLRPRYGIYAVTGRLPDGRLLHGAANVGIRPSFDPPVELLEPHFFDFAEDLYDQTIEIAFHAFLRGEEKFDSLDDLKAQMARDCEEARARLSASGL